MSFFFLKQKTSYYLRISDLSSDVCSSDLFGTLGASAGYMTAIAADRVFARETSLTGSIGVLFQTSEFSQLLGKLGVTAESIASGPLKDQPRSEEHTSELQSLMRISYAVFCLKNKKTTAY